MQGVRVAAPLLEASANATGPKGSESVELVGADSSLRQLGGALVRHTELEPFAGIGAVLLPAPLAAHLGVTKFGWEVTLHSTAGPSTRRCMSSSTKGRSGAGGEPDRRRARSSTPRK